MNKKRFYIGSLSTALLLGIASTSIAEITEISATPAPTLLLPYFEADASGNLKPKSTPTPSSGRANGTEGQNSTKDYKKKKKKQNSVAGSAPTATPTPSRFGVGFDPSSGSANRTEDQSSTKDHKKKEQQQEKKKWHHKENEKEDTSN